MPISNEQFRGIWRTLKSQLTVPYQWTTDGGLEEEAMGEAWTSLKHLEYEQVASTAHNYLASGETRFPTWGQLLALLPKIEQWKEPPRKPDESADNGLPFILRNIVRGAPREFIETPEWRALCVSLDMDPVLLFDNYQAAVNERAQRQAAKVKLVLPAAKVRYEDEYVYSAKVGNGGAIVKRRIAPALETREWSA